MAPIESELTDAERADADAAKDVPRIVPNRRDLRSYGLRRRRYNTSHGRNRAVPHPLAGKWSAKAGRLVREAAGAEDAQRVLDSEAVA